MYVSLRSCLHNTPRRGNDSSHNDDQPEFVVQPSRKQLGGHILLGVADEKVPLAWLVDVLADCSGDGHTCRRSGQSNFQAACFKPDMYTQPAPVPEAVRWGIGTIAPPSPEKLQR